MESKPTTSALELTGRLSIRLTFSDLCSVKTVFGSCIIIIGECLHGSHTKT